MKQSTGLWIGMGVVVWLGFLIFIRLVGDSVFSAGNPVLVVFFAAAFPMVWGTMRLISVLTGVPMQGLLMPVVIMTFTALMIDGVVINFTDFYGDTDDQVRAAASFLLFGAGAGLVCAWWLSDER